MLSTSASPLLSVETALLGLRERMRAIEQRVPARSHSAPTGWNLIDRLLPGGGLSFGAIHEWFGLSDEARPVALSGRWVPPLLVLIHLVACATGGGGGGGGWSAWIGQRIWPSPHALARSRCSFTRALLVDPPGDTERLWAIDAALRVPGMVVVCDGTGLDTAATRRLQLAAEAGGSIAFIARPVREVDRLSVAATRWSISRTPAPDQHPRWRITMLRCKGAAMAVTNGASLELERNDDGAIVAVPSDLRLRCGPAAAAS